jgi:signal transduction histidine kinase
VPEIVGVWPLALTIAALLAGMRFDRARRRASLNRALHELRRPLQALALTRPDRPLPAPDPVDLALVALTDLDHAINGSQRAIELAPVPVRSLVEAAVERWRVPAARADHALELCWDAGGVSVLADRMRIAQALDNLLVNAIEHGGLLIRIDAALCERGVRIAVRDSGRAQRGPGDAWPGGSGRVRDNRRGHGLAIAAAIIEAHGGRLLYEPGRASTMAILELPLAPDSGGRPVAAAAPADRPGADRTAPAPAA